MPAYSRKRAITETEKNEILERMLAVWKANPQLRFMQRLGTVLHGDQYHLEDYDMIQELESAYEK